MKPKAVITLKEVPRNRKASLISVIIVCLGAVAFICLAMELHQSYREAHYTPPYDLKTMMQRVALIQKANDIKRAKQAAQKASPTPSPSPSTTPVAAVPAAPAFDESSFFSNASATPPPTLPSSQ